MPFFTNDRLLLLWPLMMTLPVSSAATLEKSWTLFHSLNAGQDFVRRGSIVLAVDPETDGAVDISITNDNSTLNEATFLASKAPGAMYQLKLVEEGSNTDFVLTSVPGCQLLRANFREEIVITLGTHGSAVSLTYIPLVSPLAPTSCDHEIWDAKIKNLPEGWDSRISWETATPGMVLRATLPPYKPPPGLKWLPRLGSNGKLYNAQGPPGGKEGEGGGGGGPAPEVDNTPMGFLKRYWYILLPLMIANFMGGGDSPPAEGEGGAEGAVAGGAAAVAGGAAAAGGGGGARKRRGKRD